MSRHTSEAWPSSSVTSILLNVSGNEMVLIIGQHIEWKKRKNKRKRNFTELHQLASARSSGRSDAVLDFESSLSSLAALPQ